MKALGLYRKTRIFFAAALTQDLLAHYESPLPSLPATGFC